jgi:hypothetical protein
MVARDFGWCPKGTIEVAKDLARHLDLRAIDRSPRGIRSLVDAITGDLRAIVNKVSGLCGTLGRDADGSLGTSFASRRFLPAAIPATIEEKRSVVPRLSIGSLPHQTANRNDAAEKISQLPIVHAFIVTLKPLSLEHDFSIKGLKDARLNGTNAFQIRWYPRHHRCKRSRERRSMAVTARSETPRCTGRLGSTRSNPQ